MSSYWIEKCLDGSCSQSHTKYGQKTDIQCACNALMAICWARVRKLSYLDASDLPVQITLKGYLCHINKLYLQDRETVIGRRFLLNLFQNTNAALLFINSTVTAIICVLVYITFLIHTV